MTTLQILDLILPEFRQLGLGAAPGGDAEGALGKHLNPFRRKGEKPVAYWSGIVEADATARELKYVVPDYFNGTLRVMAVAVANERVGVYDGRTIVRGDFVLSPNAPTTVTPGDEFDVSVGVANNVAGSGRERGRRSDAADRPGARSRRRPHAAGDDRRRPRRIGALPAARSRRARACESHVQRAHRRRAVRRVAST